MKKVKILLIACILLCLVLSFAGCGSIEQASFSDVYSGNVATAKAYKKAVNVTEFGNLEEIIDNEKQIVLLKKTDVEKAVKGVKLQGGKYVEADTTENITVYTIYDLASEKVIATYEGMEYKYTIVDDGNSYTKELMSLTVTVSSESKDMGIPLYSVEKLYYTFDEETAVGLKFAIATYYADGTEFIPEKEYEYNDEVLFERETAMRKVKYYLTVGENYYYPENGKYEFAFTYDTLANYPSIINAFENKSFYRYGDRLYYFETYLAPKIFIADMKLQNVYIKELPSYYDIESNSCIILPNGDFVYQYEICEAYDSKDYTYLDGNGLKFSLNTVKISVEKYKEKEIDFDYKFGKFYIPDDSGSYCFFTDGVYTLNDDDEVGQMSFEKVGMKSADGDKDAGTLVCLMPIENERLEEGDAKKKYVFIDEDLSVKFELPKMVDNQNGILYAFNGYYKTEDFASKSYYIGKDGTAHASLDGFYDMWEDYWITDFGDCNSVYKLFNDGEKKYIYNLRTFNKYELAEDESIYEAYENMIITSVYDDATDSCTYYLLAGDDFKKSTIGCTNSDNDTYLNGIECRELGFMVVETVDKDNGYHKYTLVNSYGETVLSLTENADVLYYDFNVSEYNGRISFIEAKNAESDYKVYVLAK